MVNYSEESLYALKKRIKIYSAVMIAAAAVCFAVCFVLCFFVNRGNKILIISVNSAVTALCGCVILACLFGFFFPCKSRIAHVKEILSSKRNSMTCNIVGIGSSLTVKKEISATQIIVSDGSEHVFYWENSLGGFPFKAGDKAKISVGRNFIVSYEAVTEDA